ncbi:hypothetical protein [Verrucomicrobium spinosum]|uniref:hypothetical protein n=1 Tax=Verrucomicrobium spinosum TaxID=2736 RepID=UPI00017460E9|nr:hypothetical protein [Verrucomicrobium spinosum]
MKIIPLLMLCCLMLVTSPAKAGWFPEKKDDHKERLVFMENQLQSQRKTSDGWAIAAGMLCIGCVFLFVLGTALGSKARHAASQPQRQPLD